MRSAWDRSVPKNVWQPAAQAVSQHERVALSLPAREAGHASRARERAAQCYLLSLLCDLCGAFRRSTLSPADARTLALQLKQERNRQDVACTCHRRRG